jgi:hypothetical protein
LYLQREEEKKQVSQRAVALVAFALYSHDVDTVEDPLAAQLIDQLQKNNQR